MMMMLLLFVVVVVCYLLTDHGIAEEEGGKKERISLATWAWFVFVCSLGEERKRGRQAQYFRREW